MRISGVQPSPPKTAHLTCKNFPLLIGNDFVLAVCVIVPNKFQYTQPDVVAMKKAKRELKSVDVEFISLVGKAANKKTIIYKSANVSPGSVQFEKIIPIAKVNDEKRLVYGIVYAPEQVDTQGDIMKAANIEKMAHAFLAKSKTDAVDTQHDDVADEGTVVESWIVRKSDELFPDDEGAWAVAIKVKRDETWDAIKKGDITGLSMAGPAVVEEIEKSAILKSVLDIVRKKFGKATVAKDFDEQMVRQNFFPMMDAMYSAFWQILDDDSIADKKAAIAESLQQFKDQFTAAKSAADTQPGDDDMKVEEVQALVDTAVQSALKPLNETVTSLTKSVTDLTASLNERVEKIEKSTAGRGTIPGNETETADEAKIRKEVEAEIQKAVG